jgi:hypothetical protein
MKSVRSIARHILNRVVAGLTKVEMLGTMCDLRVGEEAADR